MSMPASVRERAASTPRPSSDGAKLEALAPPCAVDWSELGPGPKLGFLKQLRDATERLSIPWAALGNQLRGISEGDEAQAGLSATGWLSGPTYFAGRIAGYLQTYGRCASHGRLPPARVAASSHGAGHARGLSARRLGPPGLA
jgi:hypothetical protein